jgi:uncharacterized protein
MTNKSNPEQRSFGNAPLATGRKVSGLAARFNSRSENLGTEGNPIYEIILPGAFDNVLNDDVRCLYNHDANFILARSRKGKGTLRLWISSEGLNYEFQAPNTQAGNDLLEMIKRGDVSQSSFSFTVGKDSYKSEFKGTLRTIEKIKALHDVSPVCMPAYTDTSVTARNKSNNKPPDRELQDLCLLIGLK